MGSKKKRPTLKRWPQFDTLKTDKYFEVPVADHAAIRQAATRAFQRTGKKFSVRKFPFDGKETVRVYRLS